MRDEPEGGRVQKGVVWWRGTNHFKITAKRAEEALVGVHHHEENLISIECTSGM
jgi:hypothetical protein